MILAANLAPAPPATVDLLAFALAGKRFALPAADVREVVRCVAVTPLPLAPAAVEGVVNVRGRVVPVYDLRARFHLPAVRPRPSDFLILTALDDRTAAVRVEAVEDLLSVPQFDVEAAADLPFVQGVVKLPDGLVFVHDLRTFLSQAEEVELDHALANEAAGGSLEGER